MKSIILIIATILIMVAILGCASSSDKVTLNKISPTMYTLSVGSSGTKSTDDYKTTMSIINQISQLSPITSISTNTGTSTITTITLEKPSNLYWNSMTKTVQEEVIRNHHNHHGKDDVCK